MLKHPLNHSTTIRMCGKPVDLICESVYDELDMLRRYTLDGLLNDVIAILVFDTFEYVSFELFDHTGLLVGQNVLESLLHNSAAVHLGRKVHHAVFHLVCQYFLLCLTTVLKQLLNDVVAKDIGH